MGRTRRLALPQLIEEGHSALILLDDKQQIRMVSPGMCRLIGWTADDLLFRKCERMAPRTGKAEDLLAVALAPSAAVWNGSISTEETVLPHRDGTALRLRLFFVPLRNSENQTAGVLIAGERLPAGSSGNSGSTFFQQLHAEINALRLDLRKRFQSDSYIGRCSALRKALRQAELAAGGRSNFMIIGPEGSGRRHLARLIHQSGSSPEAVCAVLNCHLLTTELLMTTLHQLKKATSDKSAAVQHRLGMLVLAEVDRMPVEVQHWLLKNSDMATGSVWLAATSTQYSAGSASQDSVAASLLPELGSALTTMRIELPAVHDRDQDVLLLSQHFLDQNRRERQTIPESLSDAVRRKFLTYRWPGNVRELRAVVEAASRAGKTAELQLDDLPMSFRAGQTAQLKGHSGLPDPLSLEDLLMTYEKQVISDMLHVCKGNRTEAARRLGMTRPKLYRRMKTLGLDPGDD